MADFVASPVSDPGPRTDGPRPNSTGGRLLGYAVGAAMVAGASLVAFVVDNVVQASNLSLVFVVPVIVAAVSFGWGPAFVSVLLSVAAFNFFFIEPRMTFEVASPADLWALALLLVVAAIASTVAAQSRQRALAAAQAAAAAEALHDLAHAVIRAEPGSAVIGLAAQSLGRIFDAPAVVLREAAGRLTVAATSGGAALSAADLEAAQWALANDKPTRAEAYPFDQSTFDFWPARGPGARGLVLGVKLTGRAEGRPDVPDRHVELVAGYLAAARGSVDA